MTAPSWAQALAEPAALAIQALRTQRVRSVLGVAGIVIGIVTVVLVASILANARNQVALLFRDLGTDKRQAKQLEDDLEKLRTEHAELKARVAKLEARVSVRNPSKKKKLARGRA